MSQSPDDCPDTVQNGRAIPQCMSPPCSVDDTTEVLELWSGNAELKQPRCTLSGASRVFIDLLPSPAVKFEIQADNCNVGIHELFCANLDVGELTSTAPVGRLRVQPFSSNGSFVTGAVETWIDAPGDAITSAKFLIINGPFLRGEPLRRGSACFTGRLQVKVNGATVTVDPLTVDKQSRRSVFQFTHVAQIRFDSPQAITAVELIRNSLFRTLSLMRGRWVGLLGAWLFDGDQLVHVCPNVTKTSRNGGSHSWCDDSILGVFDELFCCLHAAYQDPKRGEAIQTGFHWLIESSLCAGGVEGSLVLQQAALEALAWYDIVVRRRLCGESGFEKLPASDKIRWLTSLYSIPTTIPPHCKELIAYANAFAHLKMKDLPEVLADVRNALIHGTPTKVDRLFGRVRGDDERTELWYQLGGILEQAILAMVGYQGMVIRRDVDSVLQVNAVKIVPWAPAQVPQDAADDD